MYALNNTLCAGVEIRRNYTFSKDSGSRVFSVFVCADRSIIVVLGLLWSRHHVRQRSSVCSAFKHVCFCLLLSIANKAPMPMPQYF